MSEFRRPRPEDTFVWPSSVWHAGFQAMLREIVVSKGFELWGVNSTLTFGVLGGFAWGNPTGLETTVGPGVAIVHGTEDPPTPDFQVVYNEDLLTAVHEEPDEDHRIDTVSLVWTVEADTAQLIGRTGNALPANTNTQSGCSCELVITKGTATSGTPVAPAGPAGSLKLFEIYVTPEGDLFEIDARQYAPGPRNRPGTHPLRVHTPNTATAAELFDIVVRATGRGEMSEESRQNWISSLRWNKEHDWPTVHRGLDEAGEAAGPLYPMLIPGGREWWRSTSWLGFLPAIEGELNNLDVQRLMVSGCVEYARSGAAVSNGLNGDFVTIPIEGGRGLEIVEAYLRYRTTEAFDGSNDISHPNYMLTLYRTTGAGFTEAIGTATPVLTTVHTPVQSLPITMPDPVVLAAGDTIHAVLKIARSGTSAGVVQIFGVDLKFREGRA